jgi:hypothetical protein
MVMSAHGVPAAEPGHARRARRSDAALVVIAETIEAARAALRGEPEPLVLPCAAREAVVAFLVTLGPCALDQVVVPLVAGRNVVGRRQGLAKSGQRWPSPQAVESSQWVVICDGGQATIEDAASTNLAAYVPRSVVWVLDGPLAPWAYARELTAQELARRGDRARRGDPGRMARFPYYTALLEIPGTMLLPHPNDPPGRVVQLIEEGDVVCSCYTAFVFGWLRGGPLSSMVLPSGSRV